MAMAMAKDKTLLYLSYGVGPHVQEIIFSILSFHHLSGPKDDIAVVVYTDTPDAFGGLGVEIEVLDPSLLTAWLGGSTYIHRRKLACMIDAVQRRPGKVVFVDGDTYFRRSPHLLFDRVGPGRCCMHLLEIRLRESSSKAHRDLADIVRDHRFVDGRGDAVSFAANPVMWNSGVIGVHSDDAARLDDALVLLDQLWAVIRSVHTVEQFAVGCFLERLDLQATDDVVFHYWPLPLRDPFRKLLPDILRAGLQLPVAERAAFSYAARPRPSAGMRLKMAIKRCLQRAGWPLRGPRASG